MKYQNPLEQSAWRTSVSCSCGLYQSTSRTVCLPWTYSLRDWLRSGGSYGNTTQVICCLAQGLPKSAAQATSLPDNKSILPWSFRSQQSNHVFFKAESSTVKWVSPDSSWRHTMMLHFSWKAPLPLTPAGPPVLPNIYKAKYDNRIRESLWRTWCYLICIIRSGLGPDRGTNPIEVWTSNGGTDSSVHLIIFGGIGGNPFLPN